MKSKAILLAASCLAATACGNRLQSPVNGPELRPTKVMDFSVLYARNCAGCHGPDGKGGLAISLGDPDYLAIADDATIVRVTANGVPGTSMPAFAEGSGGALTEEQIHAIAAGIRSRWAKPVVLRAPYTSQTPGDATHGADVYTTFCASCHGVSGRGGKFGSIVDPSFLALVSDQGLRTAVIAGHRAMIQWDLRADRPGKPMLPQDVADVVAWLSAQRPQGGSL
jgi:mono/diheme cytochrome c family protein